MEEIITLDYGSGGSKTAGLIQDILLPRLKNDALAPLSDGAILAGSEKLVFSTDSFVVTPCFFPGGDIDKKTEYQREIYAAYGLMSNYTVDEYLNAKQFDKVMDYFLKEGATDSENPNKVTYEHIVYNIESEEPEKE